MVNSKIFKKIRKRKFLIIAFSILLIFFLFALISTNFFHGNKKIQAAIIQMGDNIILSGDYFSIDSSGNIYQRPEDMRFYEYNYDSGPLQELDPKYYSYMFVDSGVDVGENTNLTVNPETTVYMEGSQSLNNLIVHGTISQPLADRNGKINKPLYSIDYWGMRLTGFLKIAPNTVFCPTDGYEDDGISFEVYGYDRLPTNEDDWLLAFSDNGGYDQSNWPENKLTTAELEANTLLLEAFTNNSMTEDKYVAVRLSVGEITGSASFGFGYKTSPANSGFSWGDEFVLTRDMIYGVSDTTVTTGSVNTNAQYVMDFEYYMSKSNEGPNINFDNAILLLEKENIRIDQVFNDNYGHNDIASNNFVLFWSENESPIGQSRSNQTGLNHKKTSIHSYYPINEKLVNYTRYIDSGLNLNIIDSLQIEDGGRIELTGVGYPGYSAEMGKPTNEKIFSREEEAIQIKPKEYVYPPIIVRFGPELGRIRGASLLFDGEPGGGFSNAIGCDGGTGGGGSHAGQGGYLKTNNNCWDDRSRSETYGDFENPQTLGSAAGAGGDDLAVNISGSGGGKLSINCSNLILNNSNSIMADGSAGQYVDWHTQAGGAGGSIKINIENNLEINTDQTVISASGSGGVAPNVVDQHFDWHVGGGGGYIYLEYGQANIYEDAVYNQVLVNGGDGGKLNDQGVETGDTGGGTDENGVDFIDGYDGIKTIINNQKSFTIKKVLNPFSNVEFYNPYSLFNGDHLLIDLFASPIVPGVPTVVEDELFYNDNYRCQLIDDPDQTNEEQFSDYEFDPSSEAGKVIFRFILANNTEAHLRYICKIAGST